MAIRNETQETLTNIDLSGPQVTDIKKPHQKDNKEPEKKSNTPEKIKKVGFLGSVIDEMKKVEWPGLSYISKWSLIIVLFTAVFSISLAGVDHVYESGVKFINCTSPQGKNQFFDGDSVSSGCFTEFAQSIVGQQS